jgi:hypothetical protein
MYRMPCQVMADLKLHYTLSYVLRNFTHPPGFGSDGDSLLAERCIVASVTAAVFTKELKLVWPWREESRGHILPGQL